MQESEILKSAGQKPLRPLPRSHFVTPTSQREVRQIENCRIEKCQILAKKGFLVARNTTSGLVLLVYSKEFQLGVLIHLPMASRPASSGVDSQSQAFAKSAIAMILGEFEALGVPRNDLLTYVIGGSATDTLPEVSKLRVRRTLWSYGLPLSACDLGGQQVRSIWMDVENGRIIVRSEPILKSRIQVRSPLSLAS